MTHEKTNKTEQKNVQLARAAATQWPQQQAGTRRGGLFPGPLSLPSFVWAPRRAVGGSLTRGLLRGLVERPEEAPLMDLDLETQARGRLSLRRGRRLWLLSPQVTVQEAQRPGHARACLSCYPHSPRTGPRSPQPSSSPLNITAPGVQSWGSSHQAGAVRPEAQESRRGLHRGLSGVWVDGGARADGGFL